MDAGTRLAAFVSWLAEGPDDARIVESLVTGPLVPFSPLGVSLAVTQGEALVVTGCTGYPRGHVEPGDVVPLRSDRPVSAAIREGIARFDAFPEVLTRFPDLAERSWTWPDGQPAGAIATLPFRARGRVVGALSITTEHSVPWSTRDLAYLEGIAAAIALLVVRRQDAHPRRPRDVPLSTRRRHVLTLVQGGMSNQAIAARLGLSPSTVKAEVAALLRTFDVPDRTALRRAATVPGRR